MWNSADAIIRAQLSPNEQVLWSAQPRGGVTFRNEDFFLIPFSLLWGGFAIFWEWMATTGGAGVFAEIWGIPFVAVGLYMIVGRFFYDAWLRSNTYYGLTTQRALIVRRTFGESVRSIELSTLGDVTLSSVAGDKSGTITLGNAPPGNSWQFMSPWNTSSTTSTPRFERIERASDVYNQLRDALRLAQAS
jgi:hypothetical protein